MPNVFNYIKPTEKCARNAFDLGNKHVYSAKAGMIVPVKAIHTVPGDHFEIKISDFTQTFPMNTAAFLRGRKEFALYFIPYKQSWSNFNQYMATREDVYSSNMNAITYEPRMSLYDILSICLEFAAVYAHDVVMPKVYAERATNHQYLDIDSGRTYIPLVLTNGFYNKTSTALKASQYLYDVFGYPRWNNVLRKLDMLGYGNYYPYIENFLKGYESAISKTSTITQDNFESILNTQIDSVKRDIDKLKTRYVNLYPITSYNKVYYDMFRNSYYELDYDVRNYNLDFKLCNSASTSIVQVQDIPVTFFDIQYHQWKKDLFTAVLPDTQFGAVSLLPSSGSTGSVVFTNTETSDDSNRWVATDGDWPTDSAIHTSKPSQYKSLINPDTNQYLLHTHTISGAATLSGVTTSFDVLALKRAEALQGYRQALLRAGNTTSDVFRAVFGRAPRYDEDAHPYFIDAFGEDIFVDAVVSTAETNLEKSDSTSGKLGDLGGRALMNGTSDTIKFDSSDFGIILVVQYIVPQSEYNSYMLDPHLANLTPEDHWIPAFENLGFSPVIGEYLNNLVNQTTTNLNRVVGYVPRYFEFKSDVDKVHGSFCEIASTSILRGTSSNGVSLVDHVASYSGELTHWVTPRSDMQATSTTLTRNFYVDPAVLDNVFLVAADGTYSTDQFICNTYLDVKAVRPMSVLGLPNF